MHEGRLGVCTVCILRYVEGRKGLTVLELTIEADREVLAGIIGDLQTQEERLILVQSAITLIQQVVFAERDVGIGIGRSLAEYTDIVMERTVTQRTEAGHQVGSAN